MEFSLDEKNKKTIAKVPLKELADSSNILYLHIKGFDINNPIKKNTRFVYFSANGDKLNKNNPIF